MNRQIALFLCALQFMTRLPTPRLAGFKPDWIARSAPYYPVVGWAVGALSAAALLLASRFWPGAPSAVIAVAVGWLVTGGFHEDGLADVADGLGGGQTPPQRLAIMKDSRVGSFGVLALWSVLTLKVVALAAMAPVQAALALVLSHGAARAASVGVMAALPYVGDPDASKLKLTSMSVRAGEAFLAAALGLIPMAVLAPQVPALLGVVLAMGATLTLALLARRLVGGFTGDVLGGVEQLAEVGLLLGFSARLVSP